MDNLYANFELAEANILAMRMGPGKHLHNRELLYGAIDGKEFDFFADLIINQELVRSNARGFQDGEPLDRQNSCLVCNMGLTHFSIC